MKETYIKQLYDKLEWSPRTCVKEVKELMLSMADGVRLRSLLFIPEGVDRGPAICMRSCYPQSEALLRIHGEEYAKRGYYFLCQFCRGLGGSEGQWEPNVNERQDGLATLRWLSQQPFIECIGYWGDSYLAYTGWCMADAVPEKVRTMCLGVYGTDRHISAYQDGLFRQDILTAWAMENAGFPIEADYLESCRYKPQKEVDEKLWGERLPWYREWILSPDADAPYWNQGIWKELKQIPGKLKIPVLIREGWFDHHLGGALAAWNSLGKEAAAHSVLQIGPWNHDFRTAIMQSAQGISDEQISAPFAWFEKILHRKELSQREVRFYVIGADRWESRKEMTPEDARTKRFYMDFSQKTDGAYRMFPGKSMVEPGSTEFLYNPENPVFSHGAESLFHTKEGIGSLWQKPCGWREDVISVMSEPFPESLEINGEIKVRLSVGSSAEDTAFSVKVMEVFPDGKSVNIRTGITTLAYRNGSKVRLPYKPEEIVGVEIRLWHIAWKIGRGSRLRVDISSSDFPQYAIHTNYSGVWALQEHSKTALQKLYSAAENLSMVELPILDREDNVD